MANPWITHVQNFAKKNKISYKEAISKARASYKKGGAKTTKKQTSSDKTDEKQGMEIKALKKRRGRPSKTTTVELGGKKVKFKDGGLRKSLKAPDDHKFRKGNLKKLLKVPVGDSFDFLTRKHKMNAKIKRQINLALNLMK
jgi:hypothetical protein|tara:strand:- start:1084 stop:1506 length:423 start_codon:yes stop_codon:yes gene_type:complete